MARTKTAPEKKRKPGRPGTQIPHAERKGVLVQLYVSNELARALDRACDKRGVSRSEAIRQALGSWLG